MFLHQTLSELQQYLNSRRRLGETIGFAPTMGALHSGHLDLIRHSKAHNACTVCSIFVNPTQFNDPKDLEKYPRTPDKDFQLLESVGTEVLFMPPVAEIYPPGLETTLQLELGQLDKVMEGAFRPGHFQGMAQVVKRLLDIVQPDRLYMGQKDFQQFSIVGHMIRQLDLPVELVMVPTVREADGLAMSSRNVRLSPEQRMAAPVIFQTLSWAKTQLGILPIADIEAEAMQRLSLPDFRPEYFQIVDGQTLLPVVDPAEHAWIVACVASWVGEVRLIDNLGLKPA
ncbi:pantoate--beta-alanine ligase [Haliscomenobacter sp.]|uniref:pantoate--beta-alanine ligase n=1 Tax=Haliscomenobacter sp. TaxID=2717303 RepID=UPI003594022D